MSIRRLNLAFVAAAGLAFLVAAGPAGAVDFGDDTSTWANDVECDDPRFEGDGMATTLVLQDAGRDATDCQALFDAGSITLIDNADTQSGLDFGDDAGEWANDGECDDPRFRGIGAATTRTDDYLMHDATDCAAAYREGNLFLRATDGTELEWIAEHGIEFGDNTSNSNYNGICDDPRFTGSGVAGFNINADILHDATDCLAAYEAGTATIEAVDSAGIDFGDDAGEWANDGECDDPRFEGEGSSGGFADHEMHDATDCRLTFEAGIVTLKGGAGGQTQAAIDFGDNTSDWANNGECDDPRFEGDGMAGVLIEADLGHDSNDCRKLFDLGRITLAAGGIDSADIDFGDDASPYAENGICDDPRFEGDGMAGILLDTDILHDATDCRGLFDEGSITLVAAQGPGDLVDGIDFGDDTSFWANNDICDDPRFEGDGMATTLLVEDERHDASDCRELYQAGSIALVGGADSGGGSAVLAGIDFGDDTSTWANDGECDDPRFEGDGMAFSLLDENIGRDATDCMALFESGDITLADAGAASGVDFGDDTSVWANDGECDDPRFEGDGMASSLDDANIGADATDCRALYEEGRIALADAGPGVGGIDFGDDSNDWANDGECDDPRFEGEGMAAFLQDSGIMTDATDCRTLFESGSITLVADGGGGQAQAEACPANMGDLRSTAQSRTCDCAASAITGTVWGTDVYTDDSSICAAALHAGVITSDGGNVTAVATEGRSEYAGSTRNGITTLDYGSWGGSFHFAGGGGGSAEIDFGDDSGTWPNDDECDDPRFSGPGTAVAYSEDNAYADASDCEALFAAGEIEVRDPTMRGVSSNGTIDFGTDEGSYPNDDECDDPRFEGAGVAASFRDENIMGDASDCEALYEQGDISLRPDMSFD